MGSVKLDTSHGPATLVQENVATTLYLDSRPLALVNAPCRLVTDLTGVLEAVVGISPEAVDVRIIRPNRSALELRLLPDAVVPVSL